MLQSLYRVVIINIKCNDTSLTNTKFKHALTDNYSVPQFSEEQKFIIVTGTAIIDHMSTPYTKLYSG